MATAFVEETLKGHKVVVFSKTYCPFCTKAKKALDIVPKEQLQVVELDQRADGDAIQDALHKMTGGRSVPRVFIGGKFVGGGDDTAAKRANGELARLLKEAGVA